MRDPNRIPRIVSKLSAMWKLIPDTRLGQLVEFLRPPRKTDAFYLEDDEWEARIDEFLSKKTPTILDEAQP